MPREKIEMVEVLQDIAARTRGVVTPANAVSVAGCALAVAGASRMETFGGALAMSVGRSLDIMDGTIARATGTTSPTGEAVDAVLDKAALAVMCCQAIRKNIVPKTVVAAIAAQNAANAAMTLVDRYRHPTCSGLHVSREGKHAMFAQNLSIGLFCLSEVSAAPTALRKGLRALGWAAAAAATAKGIQASVGYYAELDAAKW